MGGKLSQLKYVISVLDQNGQVAFLIFFLAKSSVQLDQSGQVDLGIFHCQKACLDQSGQVAFQISVNKTDLAMFATA